MDGRHDDRVVSLREFRDLREQEREEYDWAARFRGWARTLRGQDQITPPGGYTADDYFELCDVMARLLGEWADEWETDRRGGA